MKLGLPHNLRTSSLTAVAGLASSPRWAVASRTLAAILGGYALAHAVSILLAALLPLARGEAALLAIQLSFAVYAGAVLWAFAARSAWMAWQGLLVPTVLCGLAAWLLI